MDGHPGEPHRQCARARLAARPVVLCARDTTELNFHGQAIDALERIKNLLPGRPGYVGATARDDRLFVEAVLYRDRAGMP
ncbi:hypothetical protein CCR95_08970 [Thiocystis minor]|uniref:hypothetical protein n=1 Tax=Thiocystis minor TaxID=61597 RepID=UPI00191317BE|nr:hypothetical protein [Thiocystis minor]MBK5964212.1 hypothetical protein [Thiocystis minor]